MKKTTLLTVIFFAAVAFSCSDNDTSPAGNDSPGGTDGGTNPDTTVPVDKDAVVKTYADFALATYSKAYTSAAKLSNSSLLSAQLQDNSSDLIFAQQNWREAINNYMETLPIAFSSEFLNEKYGNLKYIDLWPVNFDYAESLIYKSHIYSNITPEVIKEINQLDGDQNVTRGYHAVEAILWGEDTTEPNKELPGQRGYDSFYLPSKDNFFVRRRVNIARSAARVLASDVQDYWLGWESSRSSEYGKLTKLLLKKTTDEIIYNAWYGLIKTTDEMAITYIQKPFLSNNPHSEHSDFSDNTTADLKHMLAGIKKFYTGTYPTYNENIELVDNNYVFLDDMLASNNPTLAATVNDAIQTAENAINALPEHFDLAIANQDPKVLTAVTALLNLKQKFVTAAAATGYTQQ